MQAWQVRDDGVGFFRAAAQGIEIFETAVVNLGAGARQRFCAGVGACEPKNLVTCGDQLGDHSRTR